MRGRGQSPQGRSQCAAARFRGGTELLVSARGEASGERREVANVKQKGGKPGAGGGEAAAAEKLKADCMLCMLGVQGCRRQLGLR